jgi:predicted metal-dependent enzyme (double-stranded beta helix superfamily)
MDRFEQFCVQFQTMLSEEKVIFRGIERGRELVAELISQPDWFCNYLTKIISHESSAGIERSGIWPNEYNIYRSPDKSFIVLAYIWEAGQPDIVHDHNGWGVVGTLFGNMREKRYKRLDDGTKEGFCELQEESDKVLGPGETTFVLPLNNGLHVMDNAADGIAVSINVYRKLIDRNYIQSFDPVKKSVTRVFPGRTLKEILAIKTLAEINPLQTEELLQKALDASKPPFLKKEYEEVLLKLRA